MDDPEQNLAATAKQTLDALMNQAAFDQDVNCRIVGRCVAGPHIDREVGDLIPRDAGGNEIPLTTDLGRAFLYARYDALLTKDGLTSLECGDIDPAHVSMLDSVEYMKELDRVGCAVGALVDVDKFGPLLDN